MKFSDHLWQQNLKDFQAILQHPFNQKLADGTLPIAKFCYYIEQDSVYLLHFAQALAAIAARLHEPSLIKEFIKFAEGALVAEQELVHQYYMGKFAYKKTNQQTLACLAYNNFLLSQTRGASVEVAIAAVVPCFWIYYEVGRHIYSLSDQKHNPYYKWIETYASPAFETSVKKVISIMDEFSLKASASVKAEMAKAFALSCQLEWHFWDDAYHERRISLVG